MHRRCVRCVEVQCDIMYVVLVHVLEVGRVLASTDENDISTTVQNLGLICDCLSVSNPWHAAARLIAHRYVHELG